MRNTADGSSDRRETNKAYSDDLLKSVLLE
jgi:hypothetical protein